MKKYLIILLTLFSLSASAQVKVIKVQGVGGSDGGISESKVAQMISDSLATLDLSGYTKAQVDSIATVIRGEITGKVDKTTTITINGVTYDLSANRSWTVAGGGSGNTKYVLQGYGTKIDSSGANYTVNADTSILVKKTDRFPIGVIKPIRAINDSTIGFDSLHLTELRYSLSDRDTATWKDTTIIDKKYLNDRLSTFTGGGGGVSQSVISDTLKNYANSGSITTPNVLFGTPLSLSVSNHQLTGTLALNSQSAYRLFGTGSSSGTPSFLPSIDSNLVTGLHSEAYYNTKYLGSSLPSQTGNSGKWLTTNGTSASWANLTGWATTGNIVTDSTNLLGTLNNKPFSFIVNNVKVAKIDSTGLTVGDLSGNAFSLYAKITGESVTFSKSGSYDATMRFDQAGWTGTLGGLNLKKASALQDVYGATVWANSIKSSSTTQYGGLTIQSSAYPGTNVESIVLDNKFSTNPKRIIIYGGSAGTFPVSIIPGGDGELLIGASASASVASSMMTVVSTTKGAIPAPKMTTTQRTAIASPATALQAYDTDLKQLQYYDGVSWKAYVGMTFGTAAPSITPAAVGNFFLDTTNKKLYMSTGTSSSADWNILN